MENPTTGNKDLLTKEQLLTAVSEIKQANANQVSQNKTSSLFQTSQNKPSQLDPNATKQNDMNNLTFDQYQLKYGFDTDTSYEYLKNQFNTTIQPEREQKRDQKLSDEHGGLDAVADMGRALVKGTVNLGATAVGGAALVASDPIEMAARGAKELFSFQAGLFGKQDEFDEMSKKIENTYDEVSDSVTGFLKEQGIDLPKEDNIKERTLKNVAGSVFEAADNINKAIGKYDSAGLEAANKVRANNNQEYKAELQETLGEDANVFESVWKNTKIGGYAAWQLLKDPSALSVVIAESIPQLGAAGKVASVAANKAYKNAVDDIVKETNALKLSHTETKDLIKSKLNESADNLIKVKSLAGEKAAIVSSGMMEGGSAASETYNKFINTDLDVLNKTSAPFRGLVKAGYTPEDARKELAIRGSMGAGAAVGIVGAVASRITGSGQAINRAAGVSKTADGIIPRSTQIAIDAAKEGTEELLIGFSGGVITGKLTKENIDSNYDVYGEASIQAGEGFAAGVGTSGVMSSLRTIADTVGSTTENVQKSAQSHVKAKTIKDNGLTPEDLNTASAQFDYRATMRGIQERNNKEDVSPKEKEVNYNEALTITMEHQDKLVQLQEEVDNNPNNRTKEELNNIQKYIDEQTKVVEKGQTLVSILQHEHLQANNIKVEDFIAKVAEGDSQATDTVLRTMRNSPDSLDDSDAKKLLETGKLTPEQTKEVENHIEILRINKSIQEVGSDIMVGGKGFVGIKQYRDGITGALELGRENHAKDAFSRLSAFADRHTQKANDFGTMYGIIKLGNKATPEQMDTYNELSAKYPATGKRQHVVDAGTPRVLVEKVAIEAEALNAAVIAAELQINASTEATQKAPESTSTETDTTTPEPETNTVEETTETLTTEQETTQNDIPTTSTDDSVPSNTNEQQQEEVSTEPTLTPEEQDLDPDDVVIPSENVQDDSPIESVQTQEPVTTAEASTETETNTDVVQEDSKDFNMLDSILDSANVIPEEYVPASNPKERYAQYRNENPVRKYIRHSSLTKIAKNPFLTVSNLMGKIKDNAAQIVVDFSNKASTDSITVAEKTLLNSLVGFSEDYKKELDMIFIPNDKIYGMQDLTHFLTGSDGKLQEGITDAMAVASYTWLATRANETLFNTHEDIRQILNLNNEDTVTDEMIDKIGQGALLNTTAINLGRDIVKSLQFNIDKNAPKNFKSNLELALGGLAIATMVKQNVIESRAVSTIDTTKDNLFKSNKENENEENYSDFSTINLIVAAHNTEDSKSVLKPELTRFVDNYKAAPKLFNDLFGIVSRERKATFEPNENVVKFVKNSRQKVSDKYRKIIKKHQARKHTIKKAQYKVYNSFSLALKRDMLGYTNDTSKVQTNLKDSVESVNRGINASMTHLDNHIEEMESLDSSFYFTHSVMSQGRLLLESNTLNPQGNKLHRHLIAIEGQESTIDLTSDDPTKYNNFLIALGQSMGIGIDKMLNDDSLKIVNNLINSDVFKNAITAINNPKDGKYTVEQEADILAAIKEGKEKSWSMDGLVAYAGYVQAKNNNESSYTHDLMVEADGITNGPAIATLQFGIGKDLDDIVLRLKRVGINLNGDTQEYGEYISDKSTTDNYEDITLKMNEEFKAITSNFDKSIVNLGAFLFNELIEEDGSINRKISKNPLMTTIYGVGENTLKNNFGKDAIKRIYEYINDNISTLEKGEDLATKQNKLLLLSRQLEPYLGKDRASLIVTDPINFTLTSQERNKIFNNIGNIYGGAMITAIDKSYGDFKAKARKANAALKVVSETFAAMYEKMVTERRNELYKQGVLAGRLVNNKLSILEDMPEAEYEKILNKLINAQPILHTVLSAKSGNVDEGMFVGKTLDVGSNSSRNKVKVSTKNLNYNPNKGKQSKTTNYNFSSEELIYISGGVSGMVKAIQNIDATTMLQHLEYKAALNVYDATITGVDRIKGHTIDMNRHFYDINLQHNILEEVMNTVNRAEEAAKNFDKQFKTNFRANFNKTVTVKVGNDFVKQVPKLELKQEAFETGLAKDSIMQMITSMGQYGWENSQHIIRKEKLNVIEEGKKDSNDRPLSNSPNAPTPDDAFHTDEERTINSMTVLEVFEELGSLGNTPESAEHSAFLKETIRELRLQLTEPLKLHLGNVLGDNMANIKGSDIYMHTQLFGGQPGSTAILNAGLRMSAQEALAHELWHSVSRHGVEGNSLAKKELNKFWEAAREVVTVQDLMDDPTLSEKSNEYIQAKESWDYIFTARKDARVTETHPTTGVVTTKDFSNHLHEFAAYSMTNTKIIAALKKRDIKIKKQLRTNSNKKAEVKVTDEENIFNSMWESISTFFAKIVDTLSQHLTNIKGVPTDEAVRSLIKQLGNIEAQNKNLLLSSIDRFDSVLGKSGNVLTTVAKTIVKPIQMMAESKFVQSSTSSFVRLPGRVVRLAGQHEYIGMAINAIANTRSNLQATKQGFVEELYTEGNGYTDSLKSFHSLSRMSKRQIDQAVLKTKEHMVTFLTNQFGDTPPNEKESEAITRGYLKTDLSSLGLSMSEITDLLDNPAKLQAEIQNRINKLKGDTHYNSYLYQSKALAHHMIYGGSTSSSLNYNAKQIANLFGQNTKNSNANKVEPIIDEMVSLMALQYVSTEEKASLSNFIKKQEAKDSINGMTALQSFVTQQKKDDLKLLFAGSETNVLKGYIKESFNDNVSLATVNKSDRAIYKARNWVLIKQLPIDPDNPNGEALYLYADRYGGDTRTIGSIMSLTSKQRRGTSTTKVRTIQGSEDAVGEGRKDSRTIKQAKMDSLKANIANADSFDPTRAKQQMAPVYDLSGRISEYKYLMLDKTKDTVLDRKLDVIETVASSAAHTVNKLESTKFNKTAIQGMKDFYDASKDKSGFLEVSPTSNDKELRDFYHMLPKEARMDVKSIWGGKSILVDRRVLRMMFGYRKFSVADQLAKAKADQHIAIQGIGMVMGVLGQPFGRTGEQLTRSLGKTWEEYVAESKNFIVIKSAVVTVINFISNSSQLFSEGLSLINILKYQKEGWTEVNNYRNSLAELDELEKIVELGLEPSKVSRNKSRIAQLKHEIATNPVTGAVEDGLLQNIVEDVTVIQDDFTKKTKLTATVEEKLLTKIPGFARAGLRSAYMTQDTYMYKKLSQAAQLSDFVARYALYKHSLNNNLSTEDAANKAISTFINYDLPTHKIIQYLNDMGFLWFTKYYIRVQKILLKTAIENTGRVLSLLGISSMLNSPTIYDSGLSPDNIGNRMGLPDSPWEMVTNVPLMNL
tara:strand:- start:43059 stop:52847 length:9789 start_codon:yes stop_codon:yes gene_type:complete